MNFLFSLLPIILGFLALNFFYKRWSQKPKMKGISPPEPSGAWPILGHLPLLGGQTHIARILGQFADKCGPIFTIRLGLLSAVVVSSREAVMECFTTNDKSFVDRPKISAAAKYLAYDNSAFGFSSGPYWRDMRKLVLMEVLSNRRLEMLKHLRISEVETFIKELYSTIRNQGNSANANVVVISKWIEQLTLNIIVKTIAGKRYGNSGNAVEEEAKRFRKIISEFTYLAGVPVLSDAIPISLIRWLDPQGHIKSMKRVAKELDRIVENWIDEHEERRLKGGNDQDFIDVMLSTIDDKYTISYGRPPKIMIKAQVVNLILGGFDTTSVFMTWLLSAMLKHKHVMKSVQEEIDTKVGKNNWVQESDLKNLTYLQAVTKETLRLHPPLPLSVPHEAIEDCCIGGFHIPKGTQLFVNLWKLHRDPATWPEPEKFMPERFLTSHEELDVMGQQFEFTPFGSGRRSCPGITFAMQVSLLTIARLIQGFDFVMPGDVPVDMTEGLGITMPRASPLEVLVYPRLSSSLYDD